MQKYSNMKKMEFPAQLQQLPNVVTFAVAVTVPQSTDSIQETTSLDEESYEIITLETEENEATSGRTCVLCNLSFTTVKQYNFHMKIHHDPKKYSCNLCNDGFNREENFKVHVALHDKTPPLCSICGKTFKRRASLKSHLTMHLVDETFICSFCKREFDKEDELNKHVEAHEGETVVGVAQSQFAHNCKYCNYMFNDTDKYKEHIRLHIQARKIVNSGRRKLQSSTKIFRFQCNFDGCTKGFPKKCLLERHVRIHTGEKPFTCHICQRGFSQKSTLNGHLNVHKGKKNFKCMLCPAEFVQRGSLRHHLKKTHTSITPDEKMYPCSQCTSVFKNLSSLNGHITRLHSKCMPENDPDISRVMEQLKELSKHIKARESASQSKAHKDSSTISYVKIADRSMDGELRYFLIKQRIQGDTRWYLCSYCAKECYKPSDLIKHLRIHTKEKPFKCSKCDTRFAQKSSLTYHMKTHTQIKVAKKQANKISSLVPISLPNTVEDTNPQLAKERPHKCDVCNARFVRNMHLQRHLSRHDQRRNYSCSICTKKYHSPALLKEHVNSHRRRFKCSQCNKAFPNQSRLKRHEATHASLLPFVCRYCGKRFKRNEYYQKHLKRHENSNDMETIRIITTNDDLHSEVEDDDAQQEYQQMAHLIQNITKNETIVSPQLLREMSLHELTALYYNIQDIEVVAADSSVKTPSNKSVSLLKKRHQSAINCEQQAEEVHLSTATGNVSTTKVLFSCTECAKVFNTKAGLHRHNNAIHKETDARVCSYCAKAFKKKSDLERHERIHTGEKPFACSKCDARFTIKSTLKTHQRTHNPNDAKTMQCKVCSRFFSCTSSLKTHMLTHSDQHRFECEICRKTFKLNHHLIGHMKTHSNDAHKFNTIHMIKSIAFDSVPKNASELEDIPPDDVLSTQLEVDHQDDVNLFTLMDTFDPSTIMTFKIDGVDLSAESAHNFNDYFAQDAEGSLKEKKFQCDVCLNFYVNKSVLTRHRKTQHAETSHSFN